MMTNNYQKLVRAHLEQRYGNLPDAPASRMPGCGCGVTYAFAAFGQACVIEPDGITLIGVDPYGVIGIMPPLTSTPKPSLNEFLFVIVTWMKSNVTKRFI